VLLFRLLVLLLVNAAECWLVSERHCVSAAETGRAGAGIAIEIRAVKQGSGVAPRTPLQGRRENAF
jgi:hypothetical protein